MLSVSLSVRDKLRYKLKGVSFMRLLYLRTAILTYSSLYIVVNRQLA